MSKKRSKKTNLLLFDVDGVLTDGKIWLFPAPAGFEPMAEKKAAENAEIGGFFISGRFMVEGKRIKAHDRAAISFARLGGAQNRPITQRASKNLALRGKDPPL